MTFGARGAIILQLNHRGRTTMRASGFLLAGVCLTLLGACASPRAVGQGDVTGLKGLAPYSSSADGADAAFAKAVQARAIDVLVALGARLPMMSLRATTRAPSGASSEAMAIMSLRIAPSALVAASAFFR